MNDFAPSQTCDAPSRRSLGWTLFACFALALTSAFAAEAELDPDSLETFELANGSGITVTLTNYGARVMSIRAPDRNGVFADVVLGYDSVGRYLTAVDRPYFGALVGRYANRIAKGRFTIDGKTYELATNDGENHLHGGEVGFDKVVWDARREGSGAVVFFYRSEDGEERYPGAVETTVSYRLREDGGLVIRYEASTDKKTHVNLTNHAYFNLKGEGAGDILGHELMIAASHYTPVDASLIPTGELARVEGTPFEFTSPKRIGLDIEKVHTQLKRGGGYDHNWVLSGPPSGDGLRLAATLYEPTSGRFMEVLTTEPGIQFYSGNFLDGRLVGKSGRPYGRRSALCLETQHFPDTPNRPEFPSTLLAPGEVYKSMTVYRFSTREQAARTD